MNLLRKILFREKPPVRTAYVDVSPTPAVQETETGPVEEPFQIIEPSAVQAGAAKEMLIVDVRTAREYDRRHLPGAMLIPLQDLPRRLGELDPNRTILVYCERGIRSENACMLLAENGFKRLYHMSGGLASYQGDCAST